MKLEFAETSPFVQLLCKQSQVKILDALLRRHSSTLTAAEIADIAGVAESSFSRNKDVFVQLDLIEEVDGGSPTKYRLNLDSEAVKHFGKAHSALLSESRELYESDDSELPTRTGQIQISLDDVASQDDDRRDPDGSPLGGQDDEKPPVNNIQQPRTTGTASSTARGPSVDNAV